MIDISTINLDNLGLPTTPSPNKKSIVLPIIILLGLLVFGIHYFNNRNNEDKDKVN